MSRIKFRNVLRWTAGFIIARPKIDDPSYTDNRTVSADYCTTGSRNVLFMGNAKPRPFKGLTLVPAEIGGVTSSPVSDGVGALTDKAP